MPPTTTSVSDRPYKKVERQRQPNGEDGVRFSLKKVCLMIAEGRIHPDVRAWTTKQLAAVGNPKGPRARAEALLNAVRKQSGWVPDPTDSEFMAGAHLTLGDGTKPPFFALGDCFAEGTLLLAEGHELVPVEKVRAGMKIWGLDRWSAVEAVAFKGNLAVDLIELNNGSKLMLTADHHVYVLDCPKHPMLADGDEPKALATDKHWRDGAEHHADGCTCDKDKRIEKRARISELRPGMVLIAPERIPFGNESPSPDRAFIDGLYLADGWSENNRFAISGKDGCPKEEQKREVAKICDSLGIATRWHERYIAVNDADWALRMQQMGQHAPQKHLLSINLDEGAAAASLRGIMADSGKNTKGPGRTFTSTSRTLTVQTRLLHRMFGITCGYRYIEDHGGLGKNPIHRLGVRGNTREDNRHGWLLRVREIQREAFTVPCWDIKTDDHRVYLAEHDVTVSQCDDLTIALGSTILSAMMYLSAAESVGAKAAVVGHAYGKDRMIEHVLGAIWDPQTSKWYYVDPSLQDMPFGECKDFTRERVYLVPSAELFCDDRVCLRPGGKAAGPPPMPRRGDFVAVNGTVGLDAPESTAPAGWGALGDVPAPTLCDEYDISGINEIAVTYKPLPSGNAIINQGMAQMWMDAAPCNDDPLRWFEINPPIKGDPAAEELVAPWSDGQGSDAASWAIPNSGFMCTPTIVLRTLPLPSPPPE